MSMGRRFAFNKTVEEYRRLAKECRETARTVSRENERSGLLAMADRWELIADRNADAAEGASENGRRASKARAREQSALIEMVTELRVVAQHLQRDVLPRGPSHPRRLRLPADVLMRLRSGKG